MFRLKDLVLISMAVTGILGGVLMPKLAGFFTPAVLYLMMTLLFLAFLNVDYFSLLQLDRKDLQEVALWTALKLLFLPVGLWGIARLLAPDYALPVLVFSGISTGVTAPWAEDSPIGGCLHVACVLDVVTVANVEWAQFRDAGKIVDWIDSDCLRVLRYAID